MPSLTQQSSDFPVKRKQSQRLSPCCQRMLCRTVSPFTWPLDLPRGPSTVNAYASCFKVWGWGSQQPSVLTEEFFRAIPKDSLRGGAISRNCLHELLQVVMEDLCYTHGMCTPAWELATNSYLFPSTCISPLCREELNLFSQSFASFLGFIIHFF